MTRSAPPPRTGRQRRLRFVTVSIAVVAMSVLTWWRPAASADASPNRVDLRVLVIDNATPWVDGIKAQLDVEGIPHTDVVLSSGTRPTINAAFLASGTEAFYQAVVSPDDSAGGLPTAELDALRAYEANFGIREVDSYVWANPAVGLNYAGFTGDMTGQVASATANGKLNGFSYLSGSFTYGAGSYTFLGTPLTATSNPALPAGASFTPLVTAPIPGANPAADGSIVGVYRVGGVERMMITSAFSSALSQFQVLAHGIVTWATRGVHLGYNRNYFSMQVDDAFSADNLWDPAHNCTPGEDCPRNPVTGESIYPESSIRMTPEDVTYAAQWSATKGYVLTLPFNGFYADAAADPLTQAFQAQKNAFRW